MGDALQASPNLGDALQASPNLGDALQVSPNLGDALQASLKPALPNVKLQGDTLPTTTAVAVYYWRICTTSPVS